ncbi:MAG: hypothetical protein ABIO45_14895 [Burkholderiaceae bacterium]
MNPRHRLPVALVVLLAALGPAVAQSPAPVDPPGWREMASVLRHPRCMNCHTFTEFPRQGDDRHRHQQLVMRGPDNRGAPTLHCAACHQTSNIADGRVPGAPNWHLAPLSMGWEGLSDARLCEVLKDRRKNGDRNLQALSDHMTEDALVQWAWSPGLRLPPTVPQAQFHAAVQRWVGSGGPCPV